MTQSFPQSIVILLMLGGLTYADQAVDRTGKTHTGRLEQDTDAWSFRAVGAALAIKEIAYIRFDAQPVPPPKIPLLHRLQLPHDQHVAGLLQHVDAKSVAFVTSWGQSVTLPREKLVGIERANDAATLLHDDFEIDLKAWVVAGNPALSHAQAVFGKSSLLLDTAGQSAARTWQPALRDGSVRLFFFLPEKTPDFRWTCELLLDSSRDAMPALIIDRDGCQCANVKKSWPALPSSPRWHLLAFELRDERLRIFVDDYCLAESPLTDKEGAKGLRCSARTDGKLWIDEFVVSRRLPSLPRPALVKNQDLLWLEQGEQLFGRIVSANARSITLDAKFGKRDLPWSRVRGIFFAQPNAMPALPDQEITFRPGPGFALDRVRAKLLRWENTKLLARHELLGEIALERACLDKIRFAVE